MKPLYRRGFAEIIGSSCGPYIGEICGSPVQKRLCKAPKAFKMLCNRGFAMSLGASWSPYAEGRPWPRSYDQFYIYDMGILTRRSIPHRKLKKKDCPLMYMKILCTKHPSKGLCKTLRKGAVWSPYRERFAQSPYREGWSLWSTFREGIWWNLYREGALQTPYIEVPPKAPIPRRLFKAPRDFIKLPYIDGFAKPLHRGGLHIARKGFMKLLYKGVFPKLLRPSQNPIQRVLCEAHI